MAEARREAASAELLANEYAARAAQLQAQLQDKDVQRIQATQQLRRSQKALAGLRKAMRDAGMEAGTPCTSSRRTTHTEAEEVSSAGMSGMAQVGAACP